MAYEDIRDYLRSKLEAVSSVGTVHDYFRYLKGKTTISAILHQNKKLNAWFIRKINEKNQYEGPGSILQTHIINIAGVMEINDSLESEKTFLNIINDIISALINDFTYDNLCFQTQPPFLKKHDTKSFAGNLCHYAIIELRPTERISVW